MARTRPEQFDGVLSDVPNITEEFSQSFTDIAKLLHWQMRRNIRNGHDVDDLLQETVLSAWEHRARLKNKESFASWIFKIAANTAKNFCREQRIEDLNL